MTDADLFGLAQRFGTPTYVMPNRIHHLERMPLTKNGKIDRQALAAEGGVRS